MRLCGPGGVYAPIPQNGRPHPRRLSAGDRARPQAPAHRGFDSNKSWRRRLTSESEAYRCGRPRFRVAPRAKIRFKAVQQARARRAPLMAPARKPRNREEMHDWQRKADSIGVRRPRRIWPARGRDGVGAGRQDRHSERSIRGLRRLWRQGVDRSGENGDRGFRRQRARPEDRHGDRRSPEQARSRRQHRAALVRRRRRRHDHRPHDVLGRACGAGNRRREEEDRHRGRRGDVGDLGLGLHALRLPLGL